MTSPPPHKDLIEAAKLIAAECFDFWEWEELPATPKAACFAAASAVARFLLSREPSEGMFEDARRCSELFFDLADYELKEEVGDLHRSMNAARLRELGLDAKEGT